MGHTNSTANLSLPQFIGTDKPTWLGDINSAFSDIDAYAGTNDAAVSGAVSDAASAVSQAASAVSTANAANTTAGNASTAATNAVGTANNAMSLVNQTNTKIGTLANLNTTDKTSIVNAINEVNGKGIVELWVNPDISQSFASQNIPIATDLTIDTFFIEYARTDGRSNGLASCESGLNSIYIVPGITGSGHVITSSRQASTTPTGTGYTVGFGDCNVTEITTYGTAPTSSTDNTSVIPYRIFGVIHQA